MSGSSGCARDSRKRPAGSATRWRARLRPRRVSACSRVRASRSRWPAACPTALVAASHDARLCDAAVDAFHAAEPAHLHLGRPDRCRGRRRGQERARHRHRHRRRHGARPECAGRTHHARSRGDDAARRRPRCRGGNFHGPVRARRSRAHDHGRAVAQPPRRPATRCGRAARPHRRRTGPRGRRRAQRADGAASRPCPRRPRCRSSRRWCRCSTAGSQRTRRSSSSCGAMRARNGSRRRLRIRSAARPRRQRRRPRCSDSGCAARRASAVGSAVPPGWPDGSIPAAPVGFRAEDEPVARVERDIGQLRRGVRREGEETIGGRRFRCDEPRPRRMPLHVGMLVVVEDRRGATARRPSRSPAARSDAGGRRCWPTGG